MGKGLIGGLSDILGLDAILDPGKADRRRAQESQDAATQLWLNEYATQPGWNDLYNVEAMISGAPSELGSRLDSNAEYQSGRDAQMRALRQMQGIADGGGYTRLERDQIADAQRQAAQYEKSQRDAQLQQLQSRGMGGSGAEIAARMQAQQSGANQARSDATSIATAAQMRALQAMQGGAAIGQAQQTQAQQRASAVDAFNQANTNRQQGVLQRNAANRTNAQQTALTNRMQTLAGATGQYNSNANRSTDEANRQAGVVTGLIGSLLS